MVKKKTTKASKKTTAKPELPDLEGGESVTGGAGLRAGGFNTPTASRNTGYTASNSRQIHGMGLGSEIIDPKHRH